jgi:energy-coupling factor transport system permease protein
MLLFLYAFRNGFLQSLNPVTKFVGVVAAVVLVLRFNELVPVAVTAVVFVFVLWIGGRISPLDYWRLVAFFLPFFTVVVLLQGLIHPAGAEGFFGAIGPLHFSRAGLRFGATLALRLLAMLLAFLSFSMTTTPPQIELALESAGVPYKGAYLVGFALRFLSLIQEEFSDMTAAMRIRGRTYQLWNPWSVFRLAWDLLPPMLIGVFRKSLNIALQMELRGWDQANSRTRLRFLVFRPRDWAVMAASLGGVGFLIVRSVG